jgi:hypothetical protein
MEQPRTPPSSGMGDNGAYGSTKMRPNTSASTGATTDKCTSASAAKAACGVHMRTSTRLGARGGRIGKRRKKRQGRGVGWHPPQVSLLSTTRAGSTGTTSGTSGSGTSGSGTSGSGPADGAVPTVAPRMSGVGSSAFYTRKDVTTTATVVVKAGAARTEAAKDTPAAVAPFTCARGDGDRVYTSLSTWIIAEGSCKRMRKQPLRLPAEQLLRACGREREQRFQQQVRRPKALRGAGVGVGTSTAGIAAMATSTAPRAMDSEAMEVLVLRQY